MLLVRQVLSRSSTTMDIGWDDLALAALVLVALAAVAFPLYLGMRALVRRVLTKPTYCLACGATATPRPH
jgi:hypothetical protein